MSIQLLLGYVMFTHALGGISDLANECIAGVRIGQVLWAGRIMQEGKGIDIPSKHDLSQTQN